MPITVPCPSCPKQFMAADSSAGLSAKCPACEAPLRIPGGATEEFEEPTVSGESSEGPPVLALGLAAVAALVGAGIWALIMAKADFELGWIAWGIGGGVGTAIVFAGGRGVPMAATAAAFSLLSILGGKWVGMSLAIDDQFERALEESDTRAMYDELTVDAEVWAALHQPVTDQNLAAFMLQRSYTDAPTPAQVEEWELEWFRAEQVSLLEQFETTPPQFEQWERTWEADVREMVSEVSPMGLVIDELNLIDLVFAALGVATAWGLVMRVDD